MICIPAYLSSTGRRRETVFKAILKWGPPLNTAVGSAGGEGGSWPGFEVLERWVAGSHSNLPYAWVMLAVVRTL
jgi:hypothetical protein